MHDVSYGRTCSLLVFAVVSMVFIAGCANQNMTMPLSQEEEVALPPDNFSGLIRVIDHPSNDTGPEASPDGSLVTYTAKKGKTSDVFFFRPSDRRINVVQVTRHIADDFDPTFSADGNYIYFSSARLDTLSIWKTRVAGGRGLNQITLRENVHDFNPSINPLHKQIVFTSYNKRTNRFLTTKESRDPTIWVSDLDGYRVVQIGTGNNPKWSPDGKQILFHARTNENFDIWTINADGTNLTQLTTDSADDVDPSWSPDGSMVVFSSNREGTFKVKQNFDLWAIDLNSNGITQLTFDPADDGAPFWSVDDLIYFHSNRGTPDGTYDIFVGKPNLMWN